MKRLPQILLLLLLAISISSCKLMPYRSDFDCPIPEGIKCKSLYEVNKMADLGMFDPNKQNNLEICCHKKHKDNNQRGS
ncbi:conjugal transfer protein TraV [Rickettsia sp. R2]|uniref:conjugal transfer protein TraV n=1 Tax=Rickettsia koreansis TaxID=2358204 RepID=UPI003979B21B